MTKKVSNIAASVRQRLLDLARRRGDEFHLIITKYALERLLYRLTISPYKNSFVLKGAMLFSLWTEEAYRATRDLDLLGSGGPSIKRLETIFRDICQIEVQDDGLQFDTTTISVSLIREEKIYEGTRVLLQAHLSGARIPIQVDVGFGDSTIPAPQMIEFPTLLAFPAPKLRAYQRETVIAEKFEAMVSLGIANSRMKDFYDLWVLANEFNFDGTILAHSIRATLERRGTTLPGDVPLALTSEFYDDVGKQAQWKAFVRKGRLLRQPQSFRVVIDQLCRFLLPVVESIKAGQPLDRTWDKHNGWIVQT